MNFSLASTASSFLHFKATPSAKPPPSSLPHFTASSRRLHNQIVRASSSNHTSRKAPLIQTLAKTAILIGAAASFTGRFPALPAKAEAPATLTEQTPVLDEEGEEKGQSQTQNDQSSPLLSEFLESNAEAIEALKTLVQQKLESGEDEEALKLLKRLVSAQPSVLEWKFLMARLFGEMGQTQNARDMFEEILAANPLSFEALFENALLMDRCGEAAAVTRRLQEALDVAEGENKSKEARDVRLIMAQMQFLQKNVEEALESYKELSKEDPNDFRPYFCQGMIYSLLDRNEEAREQFAKYRALSPKKFEVDAYLRTPLSRMKVFGSNEEN